MSKSLTKEQIEDLIVYCGSSPTLWRDTDMLICCPVHGESNPSMGISADKQVCHCFSCGFSGGFAWLLFNALPDEFKSYNSAIEFLRDRYALEYEEVEKSKNIKRYEETLYQNLFLSEKKRKEIPLFKIAPFKSGKETYEYFYNRGFDKEDVKKFMIGRDLDNKTVTIPVFYEDNVLAGVIGRYISPKRKKNERYKIYDFERGSILYPLNYYESIDDTMIIVEGQIDAMLLHKKGYHNALAKMGVELTPKQADIVCENCSKVIDLCDNDERGLKGRERDKKLLEGRVKFLIVDYPEHGKDIGDWTDEEIDTMIKNAHSPLVRKIRRI